MQSIGIVVGGRGRGTNMQRIIEACGTGEIPAMVKCVVSPTIDSPAARLAESAGIELIVVGPDDDQKMAEALQDCDWVCLAGFLRILPKAVLDDHPHRVLNIHPALLPKFGGKGMYGMHVHRAVIAAGETESGCTVHYVNEVYDEGELIHQERCPVDPQMSAEALAERVLECELGAYPAALKKVLGG